MGTTALCSSKMPCPCADILAFTRRVGLCITPAFVVPICLGWQHIVRFRPVQSVVRFLQCLGQTVIPLLSSSGTSNLPALLRINSAWEIFEPVAPRLLPKPRLTRCDSISRVQDSKANPQTRKSTSDPWRNPTHYRRKICCSFNCLLCNEHIGGSVIKLLLPWQVSQVFVAVFILVNNYRQQTWLQDLI